MKEFSVFLRDFQVFFSISKQQRTMANVQFALYLIWLLSDIKDIKEISSVIFYL